MQTKVETKTALGIVLAAMASIVYVYHMLSTVVIIQGPLEHQIVHLGMMFLLVFSAVVIQGQNKLKRLLGLICLLAGVSTMIYMHYNYDALIDLVGFPEQSDIAVGIILLAVIIVGAWMFWGSVFPVLAIILIAYFFFGHYLPRPLYHSKIDLDLGISNLCMGFSGVFGSLLAVMANFGVNLVVYGAMSEAAGSSKFFLEVGKAAGKKLDGGPGQTAVLGSSLVGMVSGGAVGNVLVTGSFTIPMMKKVGFKAETAGAIEAAASTGSQLMPPIMGIAAFLMAGFLNIDFSEVMIAGIIPSFLFYLTMVFGVQFIAKKAGIKSENVAANRTILIERGPLFVIPLSVLIFMLMSGYSAGISSFVVNFLILAIAFARRKTRLTFKTFIEGVTKGTITAGKITMAVAIVGVLSQVFINTGLALKLASIIEMVSFGILPLILFFTMILSLVLGLGLPASAAYALVAILIAPGLVRMGIEPIRAHFFAFYFAIVSAVTPPVALSSLAASSIAHSNFFKTGIEAFKLSLPNFIMPFLIIYNPVFLLRRETTVGMGIISVVAAAIGLILLTSVLYRYLVIPLNRFERIGFFLTSVFLFVFCLTMNISWLAAGLVAGAILVRLHFKRAAAPLAAGKNSRALGLD